MNKYESTIVEATREISKREALKMKQMTDVLSINDLMENDKLLIEGVRAGFKLHVLNEKAENPEYDVYIIETMEGQLYKTGSDSLWRNLKEILEDFREEIEAGERIDILCYKRPSKNIQSGKFITCGLA